MPYLSAAGAGTCLPDVIKSMAIFNPVTRGNR